MTQAPGQTNPASAWIDLAANQPGQAGRERVAALYAQWRQASWWRRRTTSRIDEQQARRQVAGDVSVARVLRRLGPRWMVLHGVPGPDPDHDIDHLLIGPGGVYAVNSQHDASRTVWLGDDTLMVGGERIHHLRDSQAEADFASARLSAAVGFAVPARGLVVIVGDRRFEVGPQADDAAVRVTTPMSGVRWLRHRCDEWTEDGIARIYTAARRSTTWTEMAAAEVEEPVADSAEISETHRAAS